MMRRWAAAVVVAVALAAAADIYLPICDYLTPGSYWYTFWGCDSGAAGGGSSGAGQP